MFVWGLDREERPQSFELKKKERRKTLDRLVHEEQHWTVLIDYVFNSSIRLFRLANLSPLCSAFCLFDLMVNPVADRRIYFNRHSRNWVKHHFFPHSKRTRFSYSPLPSSPSFSRAAEVNRHTIVVSIDWNGHLYMEERWIDGKVGNKRKLFSWVLGTENVSFAAKKHKFTFQISDDGARPMLLRRMMFAQRSYPSTHCIRRTNEWPTN